MLKIKLLFDIIELSLGKMEKKGRNMTGTTSLSYDSSNYSSLSNHSLYDSSQSYDSSNYSSQSGSPPKPITCKKPATTRPKGYDMIADANETNAVTTSLPWRATIGVASCLLRAPVYGLAATILLAKMALKVIPAIGIAIYEGLSGKTVQSSLSFRGIAMDGIIAAKYLDKMGSSIVAGLFIPPKKYHSLADAFKHVGKFAILGEHQKISVTNETGPKHSLTDIASTLLGKRASYSKIVTHQDNVTDTNPFFGRAGLEQVKAG
ncbi:hypothetical protein [Simkania sp.]|uniref:hypothetical protein n=1 Tax=Simkania sp. TaxID=34094 RepID=UPI003B52CA7C